MIISCKTLKYQNTHAKHQTRLVVHWHLQVYYFMHYIYSL